MGVEVFRSMYNSDSVAKYDIENDRVSMGDGLVYGQEKIILIIIMQVMILMSFQILM